MEVVEKDMKVMWLKVKETKDGEVVQTRPQTLPHKKRLIDVVDLSEEKREKLVNVVHQSWKQADVRALVIGREPANSERRDKNRMKEGRKTVAACDKETAKRREMDGPALEPAPNADVNSSHIKEGAGAPGRGRTKDSSSSAQ